MASSADVPQTFFGYRRPDGAVGIRNHLVIVPVVAAANTVARRIASLLPGAIAVPLMDDGPESPAARALTERILAGAAASPNNGAVLIVGLSK